MVCRYCELPDYDTFTYIMFDEIEKDYKLVVDTGVWDDYIDDFLEEKISISYCPFCGRELEEN